MNKFIISNDKVSWASLLFPITVERAVFSQFCHTVTTSILIRRKLSCHISQVTSYKSNHQLQEHILSKNALLPSSPCNFLSICLTGSLVLTKIIFITNSHFLVMGKERKIYRDEFLRSLNSILTSIFYRLLPKEKLLMCLSS